MSQISNYTKSTKMISERHTSGIKVMSAITSGDKMNSFKISNFNIDN
jgi:hypothetical protein